MALTVIHIDREGISFEAAARDLADNVLKPKWEAQARRRGEKLLAELRSTPYPPQRG